MSPLEQAALNIVGTVLIALYLAVGLLTCRRRRPDERFSPERMAHLRAQATREGRRKA